MEIIFFLLSDNGFFVNIDKSTQEKLFGRTKYFKILKKRKQNTNISGFILGSGKIYATTTKWLFNYYASASLLENQNLL